MILSLVPEPMARKIVKIQLFSGWHAGRIQPGRE